jgi:hypothetical protein
LAALQAYKNVGYIGDEKDIQFEVGHDAEGLPEWMITLPNGTTVNVRVVACQIQSSDAMMRKVGGVQDVASELAQVVQRVEELDMDD